MKVITAQWGKKPQAIVIIIRLDMCLSSSYRGQGMIKIREILLFMTEHNASKLPARESTSPASFCYKPAGEIIYQERKQNQVKQSCLKLCQ